MSTDTKERTRLKRMIRQGILPRYTMYWQYFDRQGNTMFEFPMANPKRPKGLYPRRRIVLKCTLSVLLQGAA